MDRWTQILQDPLAGPAGEAFGSAVLPLLLALVLGQLVAWVYSWTHSGVSYSRSFTQSLVLITMVVALVMLVIGDNIVTAFGLIGALAIIRFRNVLKNTRDLVFIFLCLVLGMALGSQRFHAAMIGCAFLLLTVLYLQATAFGSRGHFDGHLTCWLLGARPSETGLSDVLHRFCAHVKRISVRQGGADGSSEFVFQVRLRDRGRRQEMMEELRALPSVGEIALVLRDELVEI
jgi:hypothetical protein